MKRVMMFYNKGKLIPRYINPFNILNDVGLSAYRLELLLSLSKVVFYIFMFNRYHRNGDSIIKWDSILLDKNLSYEKEPIAFPNKNTQKLRKKEI